MLKLKYQFICNKILNGKKILNEKLFKHFVKQMLNCSIKSFYNLFQLIINYLSFVFKYNIKSLKNLFNSKILFLLKRKILSSFKFLMNKIKDTQKFNVLKNLSTFLFNKQQICNKTLEYKKLLFFFRW